MTITIVQLPGKTVELAGFRYIMTMTSDKYLKPKSIVAASMFELVDRLGGNFTPEQWVEVEASLAKHHVWKAAIEGKDKQDAFVRALLF